MALIDDVADLLNEFAQDEAWLAMMASHGVDIQASNLDFELSKTISIDRSIPGFREFSLEGDQAITPGNPSRSLLYHAFASPLVQWADSKKQQPLTRFPAPEEIELIENYVYAASQINLATLEAIHGADNLAIVVFANQYKSAAMTPHKRHADLVFSRTGVARVGNAEARYNRKIRAFEPLTEQPDQIRVLPAKYNAYIAVHKEGSPSILGNRFNAGNRRIPVDTPNDDELEFWVPVHKLFDGAECLDGMNIELKHDFRHTNEKIAKIHKFITSEMEEDPGSNPTQWSSAPFKYSSDIADFDPQSGFTTPVEHAALVAEAAIAGNPAGLRKFFKIPLDKDNNTLRLFSSSLELRTSRRTIRFGTRRVNPRSVPEYAHIRTEITSTGTDDLNDQPNVEGYLSSQQYDALHYLDFSGDGFITIEKIEHGGRLNALPRVAAYSIVAPPDFFPYCDQAELFDDNSLNGVWSTPPNALADTRMPPNLQSHPELFFSGMSVFDTCTATVTTDHETRAQTNVENKSDRNSYLTDGAAGVFAPGWDTSFDTLGDGGTDVRHLAAYGLGSPFPEDAKLCAALSSFWPAVAPDITRSFWPHVSRDRSVVPMTDEEIGNQPNQPGWDGEVGPIQFSSNGHDLVSYADFSRVDYTRNALNNKFNFHLLASINTEEYVHRVKQLARAKGASGVGADMRLLSYKIDTTSGSRIDKFVFAKLSKFDTSDLSLSAFDASNRRVIVKIDEQTTVLLDEGGNRQ